MVRFLIEKIGLLVQGAYLHFDICDSLFGDLAGI